MSPLPTILPVLSSQRLTLRPLADKDCESLFAIYGDPEVMRYASDPAFADLATVRQMLDSVARLLQQGESLEWGVVIADSGNLIGTCGLHSFDANHQTAEVGCMLARAAWGQGYMYEALSRLLTFARDDLGLQQLQADIDAPNQRSINLFTRMGFQWWEGSYYRLDLQSLRPLHRDGR